MGLAEKAKSVVGVMAVGAGLALAGSTAWADDAALERCLSRTGAPNAGAPVSEAEGQAYLEAVLGARRDCGAAIQSHPENGDALFNLALAEEIRRRMDVAFSLYERSAAAGTAAAYTKIGDYHNFGLGARNEDIAAAVASYRQAVAGGDMAAVATLGLMHRIGRGVPRDLDAMMTLLAEAAEGGYGFAQLRLASLYLGTEGLSDAENAALGLPDPARAMPYLAQLAEAGSPGAALRLAVLASGAGSEAEPDAEATERWLNMAVEAGYPPALAVRAILRETGQGLPYDPQAAAEDYIAALEAGVGFDEMRETGGLNAGRWDRDTAMAFQEILRARDLYRGAIDGIIGAGSRAGAAQLGNG